MCIGAPLHLYGDISHLSGEPARATLPWLFQFWIPKGAATVSAVSKYKNESISIDMLGTSENSSDFERGAAPQLESVEFSDVPS